MEYLPLVVPLSVLVVFLFFRRLIGRDISRKIFVISPIEEIHYDLSIEVFHVEKVAQFLRKMGFFPGLGPRTVGLDRQGDEGYSIFFVVAAGTWNDLKVVHKYVRLAQMISHRCLDNQVVGMEFRDEYLQVGRRVPVPVDNLLQTYYAAVEKKQPPRENSPSTSTSDSDRFMPVG